MKDLLNKVADGPANLLALIAGGAVVLTMLHISADVLSRLLFGAPLSGTITVVASFYMVAIVFLPLALAERRKAHISVEIIWGLYPRRVRYWLAIITSLITVAVFSILMLSSFGKAWKSFQTGSVLLQDDVTLPVWVAHFFVPIGAAGMVMAALASLLANIASTGDEDDTPPAV
jgi:TRAP-type C4-dicarboxylate transport system permease small subunit